MTDPIETVSMAIRLAMRNGSSFDDAARATITAYTKAVSGRCTGWITVRVTETSDGLHIHDDDRAAFGLEYDKLYETRFRNDGKFEIFIPEAGQ